MISFSLAKERERQRELAKERLAARKRLRQHMGDTLEDADINTIKADLINQKENDANSDALKKIGESDY